MTDKITAWMLQPRTVIRGKRFEMNIAPGVWFITALLMALPFVIPSK